MLMLGCSEDLDWIYFESLLLLNTFFKLLNKKLITFINLQRSDANGQ